MVHLFVYFKIWKPVLWRVKVLEQRIG